MTVAMTLPMVLRQRVSERSEQTFVSSGAEQRTYREILDRAQRIAANLSALGVQSGDRVAIVLPNRIEMLELIFALAELGAIQVPLNIFLRGDFLRHQLVDSGAETVVVDAAGLEAVMAIADELAAVRRLVLVDAEVPSEGCPFDCRPYTDLLEDQGSPAVQPPDDPSTPLAILYTSGTTGLSKGCVVSHGYHLNVGRAFMDMFGAGSDDVLFTAMPLFHNGGQAQALMMTLMSGMSAVFEPFFSASTYMANAVEAGATIFHGVGMMAMALLATPPADTDRRHNVRLGGFGPLPGAQQKLVEERYGFAVLAEGYGQTECAPISYSTQASHRDRDSAGRPVSWLHVKVVDERDQEAQVGEVGEIVVRPEIPNAMFQGYWNNPGATLKKFRNLWYHTGDLGRINADGFLFFVDRVNDAVRRGGENISSMELEKAIGKHAKVQEIAVHALPSDMTEDDVKACIVPVPGETLTPEELFDFFRAELPYFAIPRYVELLTELPKTAATFRVQKHRLRERGVTSETWDFEALGLVVQRADRRHAGASEVGDA